MTASTSKEQAEIKKRNRATEKERADREAEALQLLNTGAGTAYAAACLAKKYGVTLRQARRYVSVASFELVEPATPAELDRQGMLSLHRLDLIAGRAMAEEDHELAIKATRAHSQALAQFRRAITAPATRFKLPTDLGFATEQAMAAQASPVDPASIPF